MSELVVEFADGQDGLVALAGLIRCYVDEQGWSSEPHHLDEIETLPGEYAAPQGRAFVVRDRESGPVGCVVLRSIAQWCPECVEMRRLYVIPQARAGAAQHGCSSRRARRGRATRGIGDSGW